MEVRSESIQVRCDKLPASVIPRTRLQVWFFRVCTPILVWTCLVQFVAVGQLWRPHLFSSWTNRVLQFTQRPLHLEVAVHSPPPLVPLRNYTSNGFLRVSCNGGLNQMRAAICDMVTVARLLNLTLVVPELDKASFWADPSNFEDIFDVRHFINSLRDEIRIIRRLPKRVNREYGQKILVMSPVSWSNEKYYLQQILPLLSQNKVLHFNRTDSRLANNGIPLDLQKLRCRVNFQALKFTPQIEALGHKLIRMLQEKGPFVALHLRYEMDMLAFSGCTHGCTEEEAEQLKQMRYAYPWWREKEIFSDLKRSQGLCPLTPEETALVLQALGFDKETQIYIAAGEIYGGERRLAVLRAAFPRSIKKESLLASEELQQFQNHSSQMAALDFMVSVASNTFIPTYDGNMAKVVEGHRSHSLPNRAVELGAMDSHRSVRLQPLHSSALSNLAGERHSPHPSTLRSARGKEPIEENTVALSSICVHDHAILNMPAKDVPLCIYDNLDTGSTDAKVDEKSSGEPRHNRKISLKLKEKPAKTSPKVYRSKKKARISRSDMIDDLYLNNISLSDTTQPSDISEADLPTFTDP